MGIANKPAAAFKVPINYHSREGLKARLYFLRTPSRPTWLKIGITRDLEQRLYGMRLGNPDIECVAYRTIPREFDRQVERMVHEAFVDRARGREWFEVTLAEALRVANPIIARAATAAKRLPNEMWA